MAADRKDSIRPYGNDKSKQAAWQDCRIVGTRIIESGERLLERGAGFRGPGGVLCIALTAQVVDVKRSIY
jgi:hypothetical protein